MLTRGPKARRAQRAANSATRNTTKICTKNQGVPAPNGLSVNLGLLNGEDTLLDTTFAVLFGSSSTEDPFFFPLALSSPGIVKIYLHGERRSANQAATCENVELRHIPQPYRTKRKHNTNNCTFHIRKPTHTGRTQENDQESLRILHLETRFIDVTELASLDHIHAIVSVKSIAHDDHICTIDDHKRQEVHSYSPCPTIREHFAFLK
jgi:hypothetical protein